MQRLPRIGGGFVRSARTSPPQVPSDQRRERPPPRCLQAELSGRLEAERPRNAVDVRHRLDKDGKRYGKVIAYEVSELRAEEILAGACNAMENYELAPGDAASAVQERWVLSAGAEEGARSELQRKNDRRVLTNSCSDLLERREEALTEALMGGRLTSATLPDFLCAQLQGCPEEAEHAKEGAVAGAAGSDEL
jgi:hypothetical protein